MKKKYLIISCFLVLGITFTALFISSCSKDGNTSIMKSDETSDILSFQNLEEYKETQNKVLAMNLEELKTYEKSNGYESFGRKCDELYFSINPEDFKSLDEVKEFVAKNSKYLQLVEVENGEFTLETVLSSSGNRYFLNSDKMFKINGTVYKVYEEGIASTNIANIEKLKNINYEAILSYQNDANIHFRPSYINSNAGLSLKDASYDCGMSASRHVSNGNERTRIEIAITYLDSYDINGYPQTVFQNRVLIRPLHRVAFVWYYCTRTISCDVKLAVDVETTSGWERSFEYRDNPGVSDTKIEYIIDGGIVSWGYWARYNMHYAGYDCWGDTPDTDPVCAIMCNGELFY